MGLLLDVLRSVDFLVGASEAAVTRFMVLGKDVEYSKGHVFWRAGKVPEGLVIPVTGEAKTTTRNAEGREFIDRFLGAGECVGLASALDGMEHPTDAEAVRAGEFFTITRANLEKFLGEYPEIRPRITRMIGALYRRSLKEREDVALQPVPQRVAEFLLRHACIRQADGAKVLVHATQADLAARLGTVREVVARILADFGQRGLIERGDHGIFISDWDGLHAEAGLEPPSQKEMTARGDALAASQKRTTRFFLPTIERRRRSEDADEAAKCHEHLGDLSLCRSKGCPGALEAARRRPAK
jgi:CRP/FNR family transcriptional regulator